MEQPGIYPRKICTICREWHGEVLAERNGVSIIRCRVCKLYYVDFSPPTEQELIVQGEMAASEGADYLNKVYETKLNAWRQYYTGWLRHLQQFSPGMRLLDIGCGAGYLVRVACDLGWDAYGLDLSSETINFGKKHLNLDGRLFDRPLENVDFLDRFDILTMFSVIEHVDDPFNFINQARKLLRPDGIIMIKTPCQSSLLTKLHWGLHRISSGKYDLDLYNQEHIYRFSPETLRLLLKKADFIAQSQGFDDHLWITATRYLQNRNQKFMRYAALLGVFTLGKLLRMENQMYTIAKSGNNT